MDPLSQFLSLLKLQTYLAGGFSVEDNIGLLFPEHRGIKCYALLSGACWLEVEGGRQPYRLQTGDCIILPKGKAFRLSTNTASPSIDFMERLAAVHRGEASFDTSSGCKLLGGYFLLSNNPYELLLQSLPDVIHINSESNRTMLRGSLESLKDELRNPQPGSSLMAQQLAYMMLIQALRVHLHNSSHDGVGWLFGLADEKLRKAIACMHDRPEHPWQIQDLADEACMSRTVFAQRFKAKVGVTSMEYLTRWRMMVAADQIGSSVLPISRIAHAVGYETESAFGKAFRRVMGCSPREFRRERVDVRAATMRS
jgi:AraC-like DNA-binding protein